MGQLGIVMVFVFVGLSALITMFSGDKVVKTEEDIRIEQIEKIENKEA